VTSDDVRAHAGGAPAAARAPAADGDTRIPFRGVRRKIAEHMVLSKHTAAHFTYVDEIDCTDLVALRERGNARLAVQASGNVSKLSYLPFIVKATAAALAKFPQLNATLDDAAGEIIQRGHRHIGLATATEAGLIVPVVRDADRLSIVELAAEIERLAALTRAGKAAREDLSGSTFTITSLGALGGLLATPIINHPEVAILGVHKISPRPAVRDGKIVIRDLMNLSISVDHRVVDGYDAAQFIAEIKATLETPGPLLPEAA
jgi:pyruvate dehydrogenase E2 component (dihydrolipoamide acetyltransferase)